MDNKPIPYNTGKVLIGRYYSRPNLSHVTREDDLWQDVLLGEYRTKRTQRRIWVAYIAVLVLTYAALVAFAGGGK